LVAVPESESRFYLKATDATLEFVRDSKGIVNHVTLLQDNRNIKAVRVEPVAEARKIEKPMPALGSQSAKPPASHPAAVSGAKP
jgi:hypothetical protein